jgi:hypothetical protein
MKLTIHILRYKIEGILFRTLVIYYILFFNYIYFMNNYITDKLNVSLYFLLMIYQFKEIAEDRIYPSFHNICPLTAQQYFF